MHKPIQYLLSGLSFFTIVRIPSWAGFSLKGAAYAASFAGIFIGLGLCVVHLVGGAVAPFLMVAYLAVITGFLHIDGVADTFDAFFSHKPKEKMLEIMKDSRIGTMGACGIGLNFIGKFYAFTMLESIAILLTVPALARFSGVWAGKVLPYAGKSGLGKSFLEGVGAFYILQLIPAELILFFAGGVKIFTMLNFALVLSSFALYIWHKKKLGGITGDGMGAFIEINETVLFLSAAYILG